MNERQQIIIELLSHTSTSVSLDQIASTVKRSKRTVLRDLSGIKIFLEEEKIGNLISEVGKGYRIEITNEDVYTELLQETINDEETILYSFVQNEIITVDQMAQELFVSKITAAEKINLIISQYKSILNVEVSRRGHRLVESDEKKCFILSNLVQRNIKKYLEIAQLSMDDYYQMESLLQDNEELKDNFPNISNPEILSLIIASKLLKNVSVEDNEDDIDFDEYFQGIIQIDEKTNYLLNRISQYCIEFALNLSKEQVVEVLHLINFQTLVDEDGFNDLSERLYEHLKRMVCYPYYVALKKPYNLSKIRTINPLAFDLAMNFIHYYQKMFHYDITDSDFVGLYFTVCLQRSKEEKKKILFISDKNAIGYLNKQILIENIKEIEVEICEQYETKSLDRYHLILDSKQKYQGNDTFVYSFKNILNDSDIEKIKELLNCIYIKQNIHSLFPKEYSFTYHVTNSDWGYVLEDVCMVLLKKKAISQNEMKAILSREKKGNALIIESFAIPHCISDRKNECTSFVIHLDQKIIVDGQEINNILITMTDPMLNKKINVFKFLYNYINDHKEQLQNMESYKDFIQYI